MNALYNLHRNLNAETEAKRRYIFKDARIRDAQMGNLSIDIA